MHSTLKRMGCFALVLVLMFMIFAQPLAPKAEAFEAATLTAGAMGSILQFLALCGITFLTYKAAEAAVNSFVEANPDILSGEMKYWLGQVPDPNLPGGDPNKWALSAGTVGMAAKLIDRLKSYFSSEDAEGGVVEIPDADMLSYYGVPVVPDYGSISSKQLYESAAFNYTVVIGKEKAIPIGDNKFYFVQSGNIVTLWSATGPCYAGNYILQKDISTTNSEVIGLRLGFLKLVKESGIFIAPYIAFGNRYETGTITYTTSYATNSSAHVLVTDGMLTEFVTRVPYKFNSNYTSSSIKQGLTNLVNSSLGPIVIDKTQVIEAIETENDEKLKESLGQDKLINMIPGLRDLLEEIKDNQQPPEADFLPPELDGGELSEKFPFCVPFDLFRIVKALNAPPVAPRWEIPIVFPGVDYEDEIVLDLAEYETLAIPIRWGLTIIFLLGLLIVSRKMIQG